MARIDPGFKFHRRAEVTNPAIEKARSTSAEAADIHTTLCHSFVIDTTPFLLYLE